MSPNKKTSLFFTSIIYLCGFFLFLEWLYPMNLYDETANLTVFIMYALFCFFISLLAVRWWASFLFKGFGLLFMINALYFISPFLSKIWFKELFLEIWININMLANQQWGELTDTFRSFLLLLLIWLMSYLIYYWFVTMKRIFVFVLLTFVFIALLDTFTIYDGSFAMIRIFIMSFIALGMVNFIKEVTRESIPTVLSNKTFAWFIPIVIVALLATLIGYIAPKYDPQWPDPVPFMHSFAENHRLMGGGVRKVGYGSDDSQLGGSFTLDDTPVFHVKSKHKHYWRIETRDVYTGKGWENSADADYEPIDNGFVSYQTFAGDVEVERMEALVEYQGKVFIDKLSYPYGLHHIQANEQTDLYINYYTGSIEKYMSEHFGSDTFKMTYNLPLYDINMLRETEHFDPETQYTQVPSTLPDRVYDLAREITESAHNRYDQVKAIEQYFGQSGFQYETTDIPYPTEEQDYVDQFLFDTKVGYCDNYSTSMVVMLRTLGIPARWVKGFTGGQQIDDREDELDGEYNYYEVTNANAHSWVEVHFPNIGWIPFEPTQGFSNPIEFYESLDDHHIDERDDQSAVREDFEIDDQEDISTSEADVGVDNEEENKAKMSTNTETTIPRSYKVAGIIIVLVTIVVIYKVRFRLQTIYVSKQFQKNADFKSFDQAYHHLLRLLENHGIGKKKDQTLREYAKYIDERYETNDMRKLTSAYEKMLYNKEIDEEIKNDQIELWERLMKHINS